MTTSDSTFGNRRPASTRHRGRDDSAPDLDPHELLALLSDDDARAILEAVTDEGLSANAITDRLDASRATVYRRLNRLEDAGLVASTMTFQAEGHHRKQYHASLDEVALSFESGEITVETASADSPNASDGSRNGSMFAQGTR